MLLMMPPTAEFINGLAHRIKGCAEKVYNKLGKGFSESIYKKALTIELDRLGITYVMQQEWPVYYEDNLLVGKTKVDFVVENMLVIQFKSGDYSLDSFENNTLNQYLRAFHFDMGMVLRFDQNELLCEQYINNTITEPMMGVA